MDDHNAENNSPDNKSWSLVQFLYLSQFTDPKFLREDPTTP